MAKPKDSDHLADMLEWQEKQYTPWEYAQEGKLPPYLKAAGNKKRAAILFFVQGAVCSLFLVLMVLNGSGLPEDWLGLLAPALLAILGFMAAANYLRQWKAEKLKKETAKPHKKKRHDGKG
jgi:hypothetical protein